MQRDSDEQALRTRCLTAATTARDLADAIEEYAIAALLEEVVSRLETMVRQRPD